MVLTDQPGDNTWPIAGATFILVQKQQLDKDRAREMLKYFDWCFKHGDSIAEELHYVPMPDSVVSLIQDYWSKELGSAGK